MNRTARIIIAAAAAAGVVAAGAGIATAIGGVDDEQQITGDALTMASQAALEHTGGGTVTGTEVGDEESYYEVEVTLADGSQIDVRADESFAVVDSSADVEEVDDDD